MANFLIVALAVIIALSGLVAIAEGVINERGLRRSPHSPPIDQARTLADEIREWLKDQK